MDIFLSIFHWVIISSHGLMITSLPMPLKSLIFSPDMDTHLSISQIHYMYQRYPKATYPQTNSSSKCSPCPPLSFAPLMTADGITIHLLSCLTRNLSHPRLNLVLFLSLRISHQNLWIQGIHMIQDISWIHPLLSVTTGLCLVQIQTLCISVAMVDVAHLPFTLPPSWSSQKKIGPPHSSI